jgi:hypothetical protein
MKGLLLFFFCVGFCLCGNCAQPLSPEATMLADWIAAQQYHDASLPSCGAIKSGEGVAATADGAQYYSVSPYSANLAVLGLLQAKAPGGVAVAEGWIKWYFAHLNPQAAPDGVPYNHFYLANGRGETTCVKPGDAPLCHYNDATDSAAATFFSVLWAATQTGMPVAKLNTPEHRKQIETLAQVLLQLQQPDGLCWAKRDYRVKYLEDNSEVFGGLCALADLERSVFNDPQRAAFYQSAAEKVRQGILTELYDPRARLFRIAKFEDGSRPQPNLDVWYPDTQAQLWPVLFGVIGPDDPKAHAVAMAVDNHWNGHMKPDWATDPQHVNQGWVEAGHAYAALLAGETNRVQLYISAVERYKFPAAGRTPQFAWPFGVDDAGWLLRIMASQR